MIVDRNLNRVTFNFVGGVRTSTGGMVFGKPKMTKSGATVKGYIKNIDTGEVKPFQFNPSPPFDYSRGATYATLESAGQQYPKSVFVKGNLRTFSVKLFLFDKPYTGKIDKDYMLFLGKLLTPETNSPNYTRPPKFIFNFGYFTRTCVLEDLGISILEYDSKLNPVKAEFTLSIRQEGD